MVPPHSTVGWTDRLQAMQIPLSNARGFRGASLWVLLTLLYCVLSTLPARASGPLPFDTPASVSYDAEQLQLDISNIDHQWLLQLTPKRLLDNSSILNDALLDLPQFFDGVVVDDDSSWARIAYDDSAEGIFSGHVFTGGRLYELKHFDSMGGHTLALLAGDTDLGEIPLPASTMNSTEAESNKVSSQSLQSSKTEFPAPRSIRIGIVVDSRYNEYHDQQGLVHALGIINGVDGLYQSQLGLAVIVDSVRVYNDPAQDPLRNFQGSVDQILEAYRDIRSNDKELPADLALVHLFSGHDDPNKIVGLGWIDTACRMDGYDLSVSTPFPYDMLLAAHEIAHNLGAEHDDGAACVADNAISGSEIMWSELSGGTQPVFSSCSLIKMKPALTAACVSDNIDIGVDLQAQATGKPYQMNITLTAINQDLARSASQITSTTDFPVDTLLTAPSAGCTIQGSQLQCQHYALAASDFQAVSVSADFSVAGDSKALITTELSPVSFSDTELGNNRAALQLDLLNAISTPINMAAADDSVTAPLAERDSDNLNSEGLSGGSAGDRSMGVGSTAPLSLLCGGLFVLCSFVVRKT